MKLNKIHFYIKFIITLIIFTYAINIYAQNNNLENYQITSFNGVSRISLTFTNRPVTNINKEANSMKLTINVPNCDYFNIPQHFETQDPLAKELNLYTSNNNLTIEILTDYVFDQIKQSGSISQKYIVHIDIIKSSQPNTINDLLSLIDYYHYIGNYEMINDLLITGKQTYPNNTQLISRENNRFPLPRIYIPQSLISTAKTQKTTALKTKPKTNIPTKKTAQVKPKQQVTAPKTTINTEKNTPKTEATKAIALPNKKQTNKTDINEISFTILSDNDRFPNRIPQTKILNLDINKKTEEPIISQEVKTPTSVIQQEPLSKKEIPQLETPTKIEYTFDTSLLSNNENQLLKYYNIAKNDSLLTEFLIGINASIVGDYTTALELLKLIPEDYIHYEIAKNTIFRIYTELGDTQNALLFSPVVDNQFPGKNTSFINTPISLWILLLISFITLIIGFAIAYFLYIKKQNDKETISDEELAIHQEHLKRAYEEKDIYSDTNSPTIDEDKTIEKESISNDSYDNPPVISEDLDEKEEQELIEEESGSLKFLNSANDDLDDEEENEMDTFGDDEYKKKMVLKLYNDGWDLEEIAKELQMSQREIDFIVKMNQ
ncbi:MAG: hypothetical protein PHY08_06890 [Candidatus Cloacimonetes bacterium]|nr:hypothetical protein [Candidatus Cloacimonadota bacterium]